jgi:hypothetical protein
MEYMTFSELLACDANRPIRSAPSCGRELCALELFCGCGVVSQEFARLNFRVRSVDNSPKSYATDKVDIMKITYDNIGFVPDFIWASPPCQCYSNLGGGVHNKPSAGEYERTDIAREHAVWLAQLCAICNWAQEYHPHVIIVIENPVGALKHMPLMQEITKKLHLSSCIVDYCAFGRDDKKPTQLWTNVSPCYGNLIVYHYCYCWCSFPNASVCRIMNCVCVCKTIDVKRVTVPSRMECIPLVHVELPMLSILRQSHAH